MGHQDQHCYSYCDCVVQQPLRDNAAGSHPGLGYNPYLLLQFGAGQKRLHDISGAKNMRSR